MRRAPPYSILPLTLIVALLASACGRGPGPDEDEYDQLTFWLINSATEDQQRCSDSPTYSGAYPKVPNFNAGIAYYWIYRVSTDGLTAEDQSCDRYNWYECDSDSGFVFEIKDHVLSTSISERLPGGEACDVVMTWKVALTDQGEEMVGDERVTFELQGEGCDDFEAGLRKSSANGFGLRDCVATRTSHAVFSHTRDP